MRIFKNKSFSKWAKEEGISDETLKEAVNEIEKGLFEANLGGNIYKKRVRLEGRGKSNGARTIVAFRAENNTFYIYGFAKNVRSNISDEEKRALKKLAQTYFEFSDEQLNKAVRSGELFEVV